mmetsp:Transcript_59595/g.94063  ORF Transcript_59595/g.94063 Transcript_59595/m.94063 type:complete len:176 (+) Transcript_59595:196-723(+)
MAPEILIGSGHGRAVDWWALGLLIFELKTSTTPFRSESVSNVYSNVMRGIERATFPANGHGIVGNIVRSLCKADPCERLAMRQGQTQNIMDHKFFAGFEWNKMRGGNLPPLGLAESRKSMATLSMPQDSNRQLSCDSSISNAEWAKFGKAGLYETFVLDVKYVDDGSQWDKSFGQ